MSSHGSSWTSSCRARTVRSSFDPTIPSVHLEYPSITVRENRPNQQPQDTYERSKDRIVPPISKHITAENAGYDFATQLPLDLVIDIINRLKVSERNHWLNLSNAELQSLQMSLKDAPRWDPCAYHRNYLEVFWTLTGMKPCTLFYIDIVPKHVQNRLITQCVIPLFKEFNLNQYGICLQ
jgi:hypothetical protein